MRDVLPSGDGFAKSSTDAALAADRPARARHGRDIIEQRRRRKSDIVTVELPIGRAEVSPDISWQRTCRRQASISTRSLGSIQI
jgi:hypothetical protein